VLWLLGYTHQQGLIHGAILPPNIRILPTPHGVVLDEWAYSIRFAEDESPSPIKAIAKAYQAWYPAEVLSKQSPSAATDIYMAARCMVYLLGGDGASGAMPPSVPKPFRAFFNGTTYPDQRTRPQDAWVLLQEFEELLEHLGPPFWPRRYREFVIPT
jgi:hypothetical protein